MRKFSVLPVLLCVFSCQVYATETYFPGDGPPTWSEVETEPPKYYPPQYALPDPDDQPYDYPHQQTGDYQINSNPENKTE